MIREQLQHLIRQRPFQPFRVYLTDGRALDIPYVGIPLLAQTFVDIGIPATQGPHPICERLEHVPFPLIERIEAIPAAPAAAS